MCKPRQTYSDDPKIVSDTIMDINTMTTAGDDDDVLLLKRRLVATLLESTRMSMNGIAHMPAI